MREEQAAAQEIAGGPHLVRVDVGLRQRASVKERGDLEGVDPIVLGLAPVDRLHIQRVAERKGQAFLGAEIGEPVPAKEAFAKVVAVGRDDFERFVAVALEVAVDQDLSRLVEDADVHRSGVQVDTTVVAVLLSLESHRGLPSNRSLATRKPAPWAGVRRGPRISIPYIERMADAPANSQRVGRLVSMV